MRRTMTSLTMVCRSAVSVLLAASALSSCATVPSRQAVTQGTVIDHVTVVDVRTGRKQANRALVIESGQIRAIMAAGSVEVSGSAQLVEGNGAFAVPGFNDMHAHNLNVASPESSLPLMLAYGVTGFRQMAPALPGYPKQPNGKPLVPAVAPALLAMPGTLLAGPAYASPAAAKAEVVRQKAAGVDFIKIVDLPGASFIAAADEAQAAGLQVSGHLPPTVDPRAAIAHGMDSVEHLGPTISLLLSCSTDEAPIRAMLVALPPASDHIDFSGDQAKLMRMLTNPVLAAPPQALLVTNRVLATYDETKCRALAADFAASQTWLVPTLTRLEAMNLGNDPVLRGNPALDLVPQSSRALWLDVGNEFEQRLNAAQRDILSRLFDRQLHLARLLDGAGAKMLAGTDFGGQWIVPGLSLHHEFDLLARAGISPLHILQMTTINPAIYLGREAEMGTVEPRKNADIVLLGADPTASSANLHKVEAVIRGGRYFGRAELDRLVQAGRETLARQTR